MSGIPLWGGCTGSSMAAALKLPTIPPANSSRKLGSSDGKRACGHTPHCSGILSRMILTVVTVTSKFGDKTLVSRGSRLLLLVASRSSSSWMSENATGEAGGKRGITIFTDAWVRARWRVKHVMF